MPSIPERDRPSARANYRWPTPTAVGHRIAMKPRLGATNIEGNLKNAPPTKPVPTLGHHRPYVMGLSQPSGCRTAAPAKVLDVAPQGHAWLDNMGDEVQGVEGCMCTVAWHALEGRAADQPEPPCALALRRACPRDTRYVGRGSGGSAPTQSLPSGAAIQNRGQAERDDICARDPAASARTTHDAAHSNARLHSAGASDSLQYGI
jgi:hypothetical protein|mmetsp:Transcript_7549/g.14342  ORF Transcript_7549/g.14342 Transcript_7549/m.14342 type:complete len:205 (-) Transcript_7549:203-817(-)